MNIIKWVKLEFGSLYIRRMLSFEAQQKNSLKSENKRQKENRPHTVYYFHEVNDPYSHLCAQILKPLTDNYEINLIPLIVGKPPKSSTPETEMRMKHSIEDAVKGLCDAFEKKLLINTLDNEMYYNIKRMQNLELV